MGIAVKNSGIKLDNTIKRGNLALGINNIQYGPSQITGFYSGLPITTNEYVLYETNSGGGLKMYKIANDVDLVNAVKKLGGSVSTTNEAISWLANDNRFFILDKPIGDIVTDGLLLYLDSSQLTSYPKSGTDWFDLCDNNNNGTLVNGVGFSTVNGGSILFDGVNDYINTSYSSIIGTNPRTFSIWFKPNITQNKNLLGYGDPVASKMWDIILYQGNVGVHIYSSGAEAGTPYTTGVWQNIVFTYTHPTIKSYMNGVYKNVYNNNNINTGTQNVLTIARGVFTSYHHFNGEMNLIQIYNRELTSSEILQNYNATKDRFGL
jgi:hypothetical protein